ncbi:hypothetical protein O6H91_13G059700 [Diphasiastrum complanatum]|nr:hypothetical protein O6H91_13G059700 [Diphasiastrum complanatum]
MIHAGKPRGGALKDALAVGGEEVKRVSLSEPQLEKLAKEYPLELIRFTKRNILRIYPYGLRLNSSNYNPLVAWSHGAQMVALNMQGYGRPLWLVQGFFRANGGCGYVKKPEYLLANDEIFDPRQKQPVKVTLKVTVCMGIGWLERFGKKYFDSFSPPDFYLRIGIAGVEADTIMKETKIMEDEWIPKWNEQFEFPLTVPEMALLRIEVHEHDMSGKDDFGGQTCLPVAELKTGFRSVPLHDKKGDELSGVRLLVRFQFI